jgi:hypothetical protein
MEERTIIVAIIEGILFALFALWQQSRFRTRLKDILREHLSDPRWNWRAFEGLKRAIHADDDVFVVELLTEIGARRSEKEPDVWTL